MRGKTIIRCKICNAGSDVRLILVFKGIKKCMSCAAIDGVLREGYAEDADVTREEMQRELTKD